MSLQQNIDDLYNKISARLTSAEQRKSLSDAIQNFLDVSRTSDPTALYEAGGRIEKFLTEDEKGLFQKIKLEVASDFEVSDIERDAFAKLKNRFNQPQPVQPAQIIPNQQQASPKPQLDHRISEAINTWVNNVGAANTANLTILSSIANKGGAISATINYESLIKMVQDDVRSYVLANSTGTYESQVTTLQDLSAKLSSSNGIALIGRGISEPEARPAATPPQQPPSSKQATTYAQPVTAAPASLTMEQLYPQGINIENGLGPTGKAAVMLTSEKNIFQEDSLNDLRALVHISDHYGPKKELSDKQKGEFAKMMKDAASDGVLSPKDLENIKSKLIECSEPLSMPNSKSGTVRESAR